MELRSGLSRISKNAKLGDGTITLKYKSAHLAFMSTDLEVLKYKKKMCDDEGLSTRDFGTQKSGYGGTKTIYNFYSRVNEKITEVYQTPIESLIETIDKEDLFLWLIDDGSWHKRQHLFHLYCNMFTDSQAMQLIDRIGNLYGKKPTLRKDRKKDGRVFNYLYFPRQLTLLVRPELKEYLSTNDLSSMMYKVGGVDYEDPLEKLSKEFIISSAYSTANKKYASARHYDTQTRIEEYDKYVRVSWSNNGKYNERIIEKVAI